MHLCLKEISTFFPFRDAMTFELTIVFSVGAPQLEASLWFAVPYLQRLEILQQVFAFVGAYLRAVFRSRMARIRIAGDWPSGAVLRTKFKFAIVFRTFEPDVLRIKFARPDIKMIEALVRGEQKLSKIRDRPVM